MGWGMLYLYNPVKESIQAAKIPLLSYNEEGCVVAMAKSDTRSMFIVRIYTVIRNI